MFRSQTRKVTKSLESRLFLLCRMLPAVQSFHPRETGMFRSQTRKFTKSLDLIKSRLFVCRRLLATFRAAGASTVTSVGHKKYHLKVRARISICQKVFNFFFFGNTNDPRRETNFGLSQKTKNIHPVLAGVHVDQSSTFVDRKLYRVKYQRGLPFSHLQ